MLLELSIRLRLDRNDVIAPQSSESYGTFEFKVASYEFIDIRRIKTCFYFRGNQLDSDVFQL